jgi:hypothetical protein
MGRQMNVLNHARPLLYALDGRPLGLPDMHKDRLRHAPLLSFKDAESIFSSTMAAMSENKEQRVFSMDEIVQAFSAGIGKAICSCAEEMAEQDLAPPWARK